MNRELEALIDTELAALRERLGAGLVKVYPESRTGDERYDVVAQLRGAIEQYVEAWAEDNALWGRADD